MVAYGWTTKNRLGSNKNWFFREKNTDLIPIPDKKIAALRAANKTIRYYLEVCPLI